MGKIKGWERIRDNRTGIAWKNEFKDVIIGVFDNTGDLSKGFFVNLDIRNKNKRLTPRFIGIKKGHVTKEQGKKIAIKYMKSHPNG